MIYSTIMTSIKMDLSIMQSSHPFYSGINQARQG